MAAAEILLMALAVIAAVVVGVLLIVFLIVPVFKAIAWVVRQVFRFLVGEIGDLFRLLGAIVLAVLYLPVILLNLVIGRWSATGHYGRALVNEVRTAGLCVYRIAVGHPLRLVKAEGLVEGVEQRLPMVMANAPTSDVPPGGRSGQFDGYQIVGSLAAGGSGAKLYIAVPAEDKKSLFARQGAKDVGQVVIKCFSTREGSSLPQIVRESRSLDAAKRLGLILDHELTAERFYYVMRYVPGEPLGMVAKSLHAGSPAGGLGDAELRSALGYVSDLLATLSSYHREGLWHKDVKPDNLIIDGAGRAHLVDFGLVTSLRSAMTLTTHGTEYFRDPEMVRLALRGVKVHEVDGTRFDIYGAGAVLYAVVEDNFPAHGVLSQVSKRCPEAVKWIIRRAMTDYEKRYSSADAMLADLNVIGASADPFAVRPADLPSMRGASQPIAEGEAHGAFPHAAPVAGGGAAPPVGAAVGAAAVGVGGPNPAAGGGRRSAPAIRVVNWWSGRSQIHGAPDVSDPVAYAREVAEQSVRQASHAVRSAFGGARHAGRAPHAAWNPVRSRAIGARPHGNGWNAGVAIAAVVFLAVMISGGFSFAKRGRDVESRIERSIAMVDGVIESIAERAGGESQAGADRRRAKRGETAANADGRLLMVSDVRQPWSDETRAALLAITQSLRDAGFDLIGNVPHAADEPAPSVSEEELNLIAESRLAMGQLTPDQPEATERIAGFKASHDGKVDVVVWLTPSPETTDPTPRVFGFTGASEDGASERGKALRAAIAKAQTAIASSRRKPG